MLIGGTKGSEGNVFIDGKPVCDDYWDLNDAEVACRQFGFSNAVRATAGKDTKFSLFDNLFLGIFVYPTSLFRINFCPCFNNLKN